MSAEGKAIAIVAALIVVFALGCIAACSYVAGACIQAGGEWNGANMVCSRVAK